MNKKVNTLLFILAASALNIILIIVLFLLLLAALGALLPESTSAATAQLLMLGAFIISIVGSYAVYGQLIRFISNRIDMDRYFHPIFRKKR
jgi:hypothetical protein